MLQIHLIVPTLIFVVELIPFPLVACTDYMYFVVIEIEQLLY